MNWTTELQNRFGHSHFRPGQQEALEALSRGQPTLALMPTGSGKSLLYQWHAKDEGSLVLVLSPLIALMQDQAAKAKEMGIPTTFLNSILSKEEREKRQQRLATGEFRLLFVTPERFRKPDFLAAISERKVTLLAVDEAHCASMWGHDFRPDYSKLGEIRESLGSPLTLAVTATATPDVQKDIQRILKLEDQMTIIETALERPNLSLNAVDLFGLEDKRENLVKLLRARSPEGATIVYFSLIDNLRQVSKHLQSLKIEFLTYHGDLPGDVRRKNMNRFMKDPAPLMLATPAFGLGIDRQDVRLLVHMEMPGSLEAYFQEVGRAGRDGKPAQTWLLFDEEQDTSVQMEFLKWGNPEADFLRKLWDLIDSRRAEVDQGGFDYLREQMSFKNRRDFRVESGVNILERWGCLEKVEMPFPWQSLEAPTAAHFQKEDVATRLKNLTMKLLVVLRWAKDEENCRMQKILEYFGHAAKPCGICDVCRGDA